MWIKKILKKDKTFFNAITKAHERFIHSHVNNHVDKWIKYCKGYFKNN